MKLEIDQRELDILQAALHLAWETRFNLLEQMVMTKELRMMPLDREEREILDAKFNNLREKLREDWLRG